MLEEGLSDRPAAGEGGARRHRIVQHAGKRYSIKLDAVVWEALEGFAGEQRLRVNALVAQIDREKDPGSSLTEAIRVYCLRRALERVRVLTRQVEDQALVATGVPVATIVDACPAPCLLMGPDRTILRANAAAQKWMGAAANALTGKALDHYLQIRSTPPLPEIVASFAAGELASHPVRVIYLRPGRVMMARATLCPASYEGMERFTFLLMIDTVSV